MKIKNVLVKLKEYINPVTIGLFILVLVVGVFLIQRYQIKKYKRQIQLNNVELSMLYDNVSEFRDKNKELYYVIQANEVDRRNLKQALEMSGIDIQELKDKNIRYKNIIEKLESELESAGGGAVNVIDTFYVEKEIKVPYKKINDWNNDNLFLSNMNIKDNEFTFDYRYRAKIDYIITSERNKKVVTIFTNDENAKIVQGNSIVVSTKRRFYEKPLFWGAVGFLGGYLVK